MTGKTVIFNTFKLGSHQNANVDNIKNTRLRH